MGGYDSAVTKFSPDGQLHQVEYAFEAVKLGLNTLAITTKNEIIFGVEVKGSKKLQEDNPFKKIFKIDEHLVGSICGLSSDSRVLINMARAEAQNYRMTFDNKPKIYYISKFLHSKIQRVTQKGGARPYGLSLFIGEIEENSKPNLLQIDPSGLINYIKGNCLGKNSKTSFEILEKEYKDDMTLDEGLLLCSKILLDSLENLKENSMIVVLSKDGYRELSENERSELQKKYEDSLNN